MIHLQYYKDSIGCITTHETEDDAREYMSYRGGCYTHAESCPCEKCKEKVSNETSQCER